MNQGRLFSAASSLLLTVGLLLGGSLPASGAPPDQKDKQGEEPRPVREGLPQRELSKKEVEKREKRLRQELERHFKKWLEEDVVYIITGEEKGAFEHLNTDEEREQFIEQFWLRRDPTPDTIENEYREEHYRRIAYANERFASGKPGWRTDRGRIYIAWGPPDEVESHPSGGTYVRPTAEGGGTTSTYPFEQWRYRYLEGVGQDVILEFVDPTMSGEYRLTIDPSEKDALLHVPGAGLSMLEELGMASKTDRFTRSDGTNLPTRIGDTTGTGTSKMFDRMTLLANIYKPPPVKFKDLEALVETRISFNLLPFDLRVDNLRITDETILTPITVSLKKRDLTFRTEEGLHEATVNVFGRITTLTGRIVETFEDVIQLNVPPTLFEQTLEQPAVYQKAVPLRPGLYKLNLVLKDLNSGNVGSLEQRLTIPRFDEEQLAHSSLILADQMERVASREVGTGQFVIGDLKVRPVVDDRFTPDDRMGIYLQVYNLGINETTNKPDATIQYSIRNGAETLFSYNESTADLERVGQQITLEKLLPLTSFAPGKYTLKITITDKVRGQTVSPSASFEVVRRTAQASGS